MRQFYNKKYTRYELKSKRIPKIRVKINNTIEKLKEVFTKAHPKA